MAANKVLTISGFAAITACGLISPYAFSFHVPGVIAAGIGGPPPQPMIVLLDSAPVDIIQILAEMSWDTLLLIVGLAFVAIAVLGDISGKISPGKGGRIAAALVGVLLVAGGIWYHNVIHGFKVTGSMVAPPNPPVTGPCPLTVNLQGVIDASGSGDVVYDFKFSNGNASSLQTVTFQKTDSIIVNGAWEVHESLKNAWIQLDIAAPRKNLSPPSNTFSVTCVPNTAGGANPERPNAVGGNRVDAARTSTDDVSAVTPTAVKTPPHVVSASSDSVSLDSVEPKAGTYLKTGQPVRFDIKVSYNLVSADSAILSISTAQLRTSQMGCSGGAAELVNAVDVPIVRGIHQAAASLIWSGDTGVSTGGRIYGTGYLSFSPMFWASNKGVRGSRLDYFGTYAEDCFQFGK